MTTLIRVICTVAFFCSRLQTVLAEQEQIGPDKHSYLDDWREESSSKGDVKDTWGAGSKQFFTVIGKRGGASWFVTPRLDLPKTSYLNISASCQEILNCQLELFVQNDSSAKSNNFQPIENATFSNETWKIITISTKKPYSHLRILARVPPLSSSEKRFTIHSINMYYYYCEQTTAYDTTLTRVDSSTKDINKTVQCQSNAVSSSDGNSTITVKCTPEGVWDLHDETCDCLKGFEGSAKCSRCENDFYKNTVGNSPCKKCPLGKTNNTKHTECDCSKNHIADDDNGPCFAVPPAVEELKIQEGKTSVKLTWKKPQVDESLHIGNLSFCIECDNCNKSKTTFFPAKTNLTTTFVNVSGLVTHKSYTFKVFTMNSLRNVIWNYANKTVTLPDTTNPTPFRVTKTNPGLTKNEIGGLEGGLIGAAATVVVAVVACLIFMRRIRNKQREQSAKESQPPPISSNSAQIELRTHINIVAESHSRVDILKDWEISPKDLKVLDKNLGAGQFGVVRQGLYTPQNGDPEDVAIKMLRENATESDLLDLLAEIKILKEANKEQHPNIIRFIGSCSLRGKFLMVTEFCPGGNLRKFLIKSRISDNPNAATSYVNITSTLSHHHLLKLAADVASGMVHLSSQNFLHRDLAARNILLGENNVAKICDFGLARDVGSAEKYIRNTQNLLPVKWMSLESLFDGVFTTASDVWSFGVLLYEITTLGEEPYKNIPSRAVITHVESGGRMSKPSHCSNEVYDIMSNCWKVNPKERPTFPEILQALRDMLDDNERSYINVTQVEDE